MKKKWLIASYKISQVRRLEYNLQNQKFNYYLPKVIMKMNNSNSKEIPLFPGYIFINTSLENYSALKYTLGIKDIIKFGNKIPLISDEEIKNIQMAEEKSKITPVCPKIQIGTEALVLKGSFKGIMVKICSLPSKERVGVFLSLLGSMRRVAISVNDLKF
jgi:transcription antitermination factor NusG